jgi:hypothetical protein
MCRNNTFAKIKVLVLKGVAMSGERKIKQLIMETRKITARIIDDDNFDRELPVFAWVLYDDDDIEPWFIHPDFQANEYPYGVDMIKRISKKDVGVVEYKWEQ